MSQNLYILSFENEPLIKVGLSIDPYMRSLALGFDRVLYLVVRQDLSSAIPIRRDAPGLTGADWKAKRLEKAARLNNLWVK